MSIKLVLRAISGYNRQLLKQTEKDLNKTENNQQGMALKKIAFKDEENLTEDDNITLTNLYEKMIQEYGWSEDKAFYRIASQNCRLEK